MAPASPPSWWSRDPFDVNVSEVVVGLICPLGPGDHGHTDCWHLSEAATILAERKGDWMTASRSLRNEVGNDITIAAHLEADGMVLITGTGPSSLIRHRWTISEAFALRDVVDAVLATAVRPYAPTGTTDGARTP
jgi:hypothetical protein